MSQRAVLVGINYYGTDNQLAGCINDVHQVANVLRSIYGFPNENIVVLADNLPKTSLQYPTKANIQSALAALRAATQAGDIAVFHYSGHGTTVRDGASTNLDYAGTDDALIPVDVFSRSGYVLGNELVDDELWAWSSGFPEGSFLFSIVDACHSGSAFDLPYALKSQPDKAGSFSVARVERRPDTAAKVVMLSGCKDDQTSLDTVDGNHQPAGALTYAFCDYILHNSSRIVNYFDFLTSVRAQIVAKNKWVPNIQEPQLSFGRIADTNTLFTLTAPSKTRAVVFDDTLLRSLISTLETAPVRSVAAPVRSVAAPVRSVAAPVRSVAAPVRSVAAPVRSKNHMPPGHTLYHALLARKR